MRWTEYILILWTSISVNLPSLTSRFHLIGDVDVFRPNVVLPFSDTDYPWEDEATVYSDSHVHWHVVFLPAIHSQIDDGRLTTCQTNGHFTSRCVWVLSCSSPLLSNSWHGRGRVWVLQPRSNNSHPKSWFSYTCFSGKNIIWWSEKAIKKGDNRVWEKAWIIISISGGFSFCVVWWLRTSSRREHISRH